MSMLRVAPSKLLRSSNIDPVSGRESYIFGALLMKINYFNQSKNQKVDLILNADKTF